MAVEDEAAFVKESERLFGQKVDEVEYFSDSRHGDGRTRDRIGSD